jgi:hypothetical protein
MIQKTILKKVHSFIALPLLVSQIQFGLLAHLPESMTLANLDFAQLSESQTIDNHNLELLIHAKKIDNYFEEHDLPLTGYGLTFAVAADEYGLDPYLLPAIAMRETTGGKNLCQNPKGKMNAFGWGSCKIGFDSHEEAIERVALNLAGENPKTAFAYKGKTLKEKLESYNPPSAKPGYAKQVISIMEDIQNQNV